ncbi:hypothetical protein CROQUDRAFT_90990 [Cronartium quercuum f. sp. fusiforme G11]|uniref:Uncharacterized protein n=1 Tax=Cronartium quercuum f. sp. fusiforme G11 TaxID=708437 RepID=A0A9P6NQS0_9BASI|nr:hypothetical protein CROQUDRAFT_90990 [Cronartium quercuum f. sp. fusiforme G11]
MKSVDSLEQHWKSGHHQINLESWIAKQKQERIILAELAATASHGVHTGENHDSHSTSDDSTDDHSVIDTPKPLPNSQNNQLSQSSLSKDNLVAFNKYAQRLGLDPAHRTMALQTAEAAGSVDLFIASTVLQVKMHQNTEKQIKTLESLVRPSTIKGHEQTWIVPDACLVCHFVSSTSLI